MSRVPRPDNIQIASLQQKKEVHFDATAPGTGTPWEDRGTHGPVGGFFKTCIMSMFANKKLLDDIRRTTTTTDSRAYLMVCCGVWGASALLHGVISMIQVRNNPDAVVSTGLYLFYCVVGAALTAAGVFILFQLFNMIYAKLVAQEKTQGALPTVLLTNVTTYAMGPSILAIIPFYGPWGALIWILVNLIRGGITRLRLRTAGAVIDVVLPFVAVVVIGYAGYFLSSYVRPLGDPYIIEHMGPTNT